MENVWIRPSRVFIHGQQCPPSRGSGIWTASDAHHLASHDARLGASELRPILRTRMAFFKKYKKAGPPSQHLALGIPSHIGVVPLGFSAELQPHVGSEGGFRPFGGESMRLILRLRQVSTTEELPGSYLEAMGTNDRSHRGPRSRFLSMRVAAHVGALLSIDLIDANHVP